MKHLKTFEYRVWDHNNIKDLIGKIHYDNHNHNPYIVIGGGLKRVARYFPFLNDFDFTEIKSDLVDVDEYYNINPDRCIE